ncbi:hypothetical protein [Tamlana sedimenti]|uniref:hypothetical protein n=1 Tax=Tamlana sedimenti TaxID=3134126 RepID=UPI00403E7B14
MISMLGHSQMGIGTVMPDESAQLDVVSENKGVLIPRVQLSNSLDTSTIDANPSDNPKSLLVYNISPSGDLIEGFHYWNGQKWLRIISTGDSTNEVTVLQNNGDGTFTYTSEDGTKTTFDTNNEILDNNNGTFTFVNTLNEQIVFDAKIATIVDNGDGTYTITDDFGVSVTLGGASETVTTLNDNGDGTYTYTSEDNTQTIIQASNASFFGPWNGADDNAPATSNTEDIYSLGNVGIGTVSPSATLEVNGDIIIGNGGTAIKRSLSMAVVLDFPFMYCCSGVFKYRDLVMSFPGAKVGDVVSLGIPHSAISSMPLLFNAWVSANDVVTIRAVNISNNMTADPGPNTFRVTVFQY